MRSSMAAVVVALIACGGSSNSSNGAGGTSIAYLFAPKTCSVAGFAGVSEAGLAVALANRSIANACTALGDACVQYKNVQGTVLVVANYDATGNTAPPVAPGTYTVSATTPTALSGYFAFATSEDTNATCTPSATEAKSGTITITKVASDQVTGLYDITLDDAGSTRRSGSFTATVCSNAFPGGSDLCTASISAGNCSTGTPTCQ